jgi:hypothetical protein
MLIVPAIEYLATDPMAPPTATQMAVIMAGDTNHPRLF